MNGCCETTLQSLLSIADVEAELKERGVFVSRPALQRWANSLQRGVFVGQTGRVRVFTPADIEAFVEYSQRE